MSKRSKTEEESREKREQLVREVFNGFAVARQFPHALPACESGETLQLGKAGFIDRVGPSLSGPNCVYFVSYFE